MPASDWQIVKDTFLSGIDLSTCNGCSSCYLRCEENIPMTHEEFLRIRNHIREKCHDDAREIACQDKSVHLGDGVFFHLCRFLDMETHSCSVYPVRPLVCRLLGHVEWMPCPIDKIVRRAPTEDALNLMRVYAQNERETYEAWEIFGGDK